MPARKENCGSHPLSNMHGCMDVVGRYLSDRRLEPKNGMDCLWRGCCTSIPLWGSELQSRCRAGAICLLDHNSKEYVY